MKTVTATEARAHLFGLIDEAARHPVRIQGRRSTVIVVGEEDWNAIQETLYLQGIPGMVESIREGMAASDDELSDEPGW